MIRTETSSSTEAPVVPVEGRVSPRPTRRRRVGQRMIKVLPSMLTLGNLLCGFAAIFYASRDPDAKHFLQNLSPLTLAAGLIFVGMIFDALDGRVARMTRQTSELGEQLDSMADMVTCGVAPAFLVIQLAGIGAPFFGEARADTLFDRAVLLIAGVYAACCALRLARFNIEIDQPEESDHMSFKGLPSPAAAGTVASFVLLHQSLLSREVMASWATTVGVGMVVITLLAALAMVSTLRYVHVINRYVRSRARFRSIVIVVFIGIPLFVEPRFTLCAAFVLYALSAPVAHLFNRGSAASLLED